MSLRRRVPGLPSLTSTAADGMMLGFLSEVSTIGDPPLK